MFAFSSQKHILVLAPDPHKPFLMNLNSGGIILAGILMPSRNLKFGEFPPPKIALRPSTIGFFCGKKQSQCFNPFKKTVPNKLIIFQFLNDFTGQTCQKGLCNPHYIFPLKCILPSEVKFVLKKMLDGTFLKGLNQLEHTCGKAEVEIDANSRKKDKLRT